MTAAGKPRTSAALLVAAGILVSRLAGLVRQRVFAHYFGNSDAADAFNAALRIPNLLQNLLGEGVLSGSFIPAYAGLLGQQRRDEAGRVAGVVLTVLAAGTTLLVALGVLVTPWLIDVVAPGFSDEKRAVTIRLVRILFPGIGLLVLSAWCLGVLNSHRRFLLSYTAPVVWSGVMIATMVGLGGTYQGYDLAVWLAWGAVVGSAAQLLVQVPSVLRVEPGLRPGLDLSSPEVRDVFRNLGPVLVGRGVVQISSYVDGMIASLLPVGAVAALGYAQTLSLLPVSLFGMSVSASELPEMARATGAEADVAAVLRQRLAAALQRVAFFVVPSSVALAALGDVIAATVYQTGAFDADDARWVWAILAGSAVGLLATTTGRLYASTLYALRDTRTPLRFAFVRVGLSTGLGWVVALYGPGWLGVEDHWGVAGITLTSGLAGWVELVLLRRAVRARIGVPDATGSRVLTLHVAALAAALVAVGLRGQLVWLPAIPLGLVVCAVFGAVYLAVCAVVGVGEVNTLVAAVRRRLGARR